MGGNNPVKSVNKVNNHRVDRRKMIAASLGKFYGKMWDGLVLPQKKVSSQRFYFKANRKILCSSKKRY